MSQSRNPIIVALDVPHLESALALVDQLAPVVGAFKVGKELFVAAGPDIVRRIRDTGAAVFLDLKFHDIPNTVAKAGESAAKLPIGMLTLHTCGGREMMQWAAKARAQHAPDLLLLGVTVLTSFSAPGLAETGVIDPPEQQVVRLGRLAKESGVTGLVCSPLEIASLRAALPADVTLVTPGIRPRDAKADDQSRVMTPGEAARTGANYIVVGRPIFKAPDPAAAARAILAELAAATGTQA